ncbi:phosphoglycolate phosphatase [Pseudoprimorskyibacter insulae]|uniref:Phosphoglycolate phosphatase n=1 Tax=Pseudoprimorskyibacter insulae TaxID=1695997 RepID=A0A2R8ATY1_9RHOB|nr:phosphoglycolate phosphatase [Pseudoprimorskyibacter insulae]SPF79498.1 Phosphoglycolate phosphatase [Pseudoprimorskyibacter insulae]
MAHIVFDLDGTLINSAPDIQGVANGLLQEAGLEPITLDQTRSFIGNGAAVFVERMRKARDVPDDRQAEMHKAFVAWYDAAVTRTVIYPGVERALDDLASAGFALGICTNKPIRPCRAVLDHFGLTGRFATIWGGDSLPVHKPDPAPLHAAYEALGGDAPRIYVGDSEVDAETAQRAGVPFLLYTEGYRKTPVALIPHHAAFSDFAELPALVAGVLLGAE